MHGNGRYVKLILATAAACLLPSVAHAEVVAPAIEAAVLAVGPGGTPTVAYLDASALVVSTRTAAGWRASRVRVPVPASEADVVAAAVGRDGRPVVLVQDAVRRTLVVAWRRPAKWLVIRVVRAAAGSQLGVGGLALTPRGMPLVAYAVRRATAKTYLRLVRIDAKGRARTTQITKLGFPDSALPPSATPHVTRSGAVRVVEAYTSALIDWFPDHGKWTGQYLFASLLGSPVGRVFALPGPTTAVVAWTQDYPSLGETHVLLQQGPPTGDVTDLLPHARLSALTLAGGRPEVAANDWVELDSGEIDAGLLVYPDAPPVELDGSVEGYAAVGAARQLLLATDQGLEWFSAPRPALRVSLSVDAAGQAVGRVDGATSGTVAIYREAPGTARQLVTTAALGSDGTFAAQVPASPTFYRGVYRDPATGIPYAALLRSLPVRPGTVLTSYAVRNDRLLAAVAVVIGIVLILVGVIYLVQNAHDIPSFFPGHSSQPSSHHHAKHGIAAILVGLACFAFAWFRTGPREQVNAPPT